MAIGKVNGGGNGSQLKVANKSVTIATNGGVAMSSISMAELGIPQDSEVLLAQVHPLHKADTDDIWTAVFYGYSWDDQKRSVEIAVNGRLTGLQKQVFEINVLYQ